VVAELKRHRMTHQRNVILDEVRGSFDHPTADQIYERVRKRLPRISMGTVYRNLDVLASTGLVRRIGPEFPQMRFDGDTRDHYHMTCIGCGRIKDMELEARDDPINQLETVLGRLTKYGVFGHKLEFFDLCSNCREKQGGILEEKQDGCREEGDKHHGTEGE